MNAPDKHGLEASSRSIEFLSHRVTMAMASAGKVAEVSLIAGGIAAIGGYLGAVAVLGSPAAAAIGIGAAATCYTVREAKATFFTAEGCNAWLAHNLDVVAGALARLERMVRRAKPDADAKPDAEAAPEVTPEERKARRTHAIRETAIAASVGLLAWGSTAAVFGAKGLSLWGAYNAARIKDLGGPALHALGMLSTKGLGQAYAIVGDPVVTAVYHDVYAAAPWVAGVSAVAAMVASGRFVMRKAKEFAANRADMHVRGAQIVEKDELIKLVHSVDKARGWNGASDYVFGGVPVAKDRSTMHYWIVGATGAGKSQALHPLLGKVREKGKAAVIFDRTLEFTKRYFRPGVDVMLNPLDSRCQGWTIFNECVDSTDTASLLRMIAPFKNENDGTEAHFVGTAHRVGTAILNQLIEEGRTTNQAVVEALALGQKELYEWLKHTEVGSDLDPEATGAGIGGVLTTLRQKLDALRYIPDGDFSIRKFVWEAKDSWLFLPLPAAYADLLTPFLSMVMQIASNAAVDSTRIERSADAERIWFVADEAPTMGPGVMRAWENLAAQARQFGVVLVFGLQANSQVEDLTSKARARSFIGNFHNRLVMKCNDPESAEEAAKFIGKHEAMKLAYGQSGGPSASKDGISDNWSSKDEYICMPEEIMTLAPNSGYLMLAGGYPTAKVSWIPQRYDGKQDGFVRSSRLDRGHKAPTKAAPAVSPVAPETPVEVETPVVVAEAPQALAPKAAAPKRRLM